MHPNSLLRLGLTCSILITGGGLSDLHATPVPQPVVLTPDSAPVQSPSSFSPPWYMTMPPGPPMLMTGNHGDSVIISMPQSFSAGAVSGSLTWEVLTDGIFSVNSNPAAYSGEMLSFSLSYQGALRKNSEETSILSTPTLEFIGLEGVNAADLGIFTSVSNGGFQFMLSASVTIPANAAFSFTGFRLTTEMEPGEHELEFNTLISSGVSASAQTTSETDPGAILSYQAVPEPSSLALLAAAGATGLFWSRSRRRKIA